MTPTGIRSPLNRQRVKMPILDTYDDAQKVTPRRARRLLKFMDRYGGRRKFMPALVDGLEDRAAEHGEIKRPHTTEADK